MGGFIKCMKTEYNLGNERMMEDEEDEIDDEYEEKEKEKGKEKLSVLNDIPGRNRSEFHIHKHVNNSNIIHYNENYLDLNGVITRKKSNTVFLKPSLQNNI